MIGQDIAYRITYYCDGDYLYNILNNQNTLPSKILMAMRPIMLWKSLN